MLLKPWLVHRGEFGWPSSINLMRELAGLKGLCVMGGHQGWVGVWITRYQYIVDIVHCKVGSGSRCTLIRKPREKRETWKAGKKGTYIWKREDRWQNKQKGE